MNKEIKIILVCVLLGFLFLIRFIAQNYFYDPLHNYFKADYLYMDVPKLDFLKFYLFLSLRYFLNSITSLAIIFVVFNNKKWNYLSIKFFIVAFLILSMLFIILLKTEIYNGYLITFYIRRFLIHPIFLLILLPAFYYQNSQFNKR